MKGKADTSKKDEGRLQARSPSAFFLFLSEFKQAQHPGNESHLAVSKAAAEKWRSMSKQERQPYVDQAGQMKPNYDKKESTSSEDDDGTESDVDDEDDEQEDDDDELCASGGAGKRKKAAATRGAGKGKKAVATSDAGKGKKAAAPSPSRRRQKEKMVHVSISCHANLKALQDRSSGRMFLKLVSLESVSIATDSYALLRNLIEQRRYWRCPQIDLLSFVAGVAVELLKIKHDLIPPLEQAGDDFPKALLLLKNSGIGLERLGEEGTKIFKKRVGSLVEEDGFLGKVGMAGTVLKYYADEVLNGSREFAWFQSLLPHMLDGVDVLLSTQVYFSDSD